MDRYCRNVTFSGIGEEGQRRIEESSVAVVGLGALGGTIATHLVRAGVGTLTVCEHDTIDVHNIQRQLLYTEPDVGRPKLHTAVEALGKMNSSVKIRAYDEFLDSNNAERILGGADLVVDGTDRMGPRYVMNAFSVAHGVPYIYGGVLGGYGMTLSIVPPATPCLACVFPPSERMDHLPTCADVGIVNTVPAIIGSMQATEALKVIVGGPHSKDLIIYDVWEQTFDKVPVKKRPGCPVCGSG
ncbi:HesA/MoeB/ThiF family protein [archaeon]|nr:MAG: HesA/MoeB/ThiF family protein [archaeon]